MNKIGKFIGVITEIIGEREIKFLVQKNEKVLIGSIVGIESLEGQYTLALVKSIDVEYYLNDPKLYFISSAAKEKVSELLNKSTNPSYGKFVTAKILGNFSIDKKLNQFSPTADTIDFYTTDPFEIVYLMDYDLIKNVYGLVDERPIGDFIPFSIGKMIYPFKNNAYMDLNTFKKHTLVTGVTGSGKTRLVALLVKNLVNLFKITIINPHEEYSKLLFPFSNDKYSLTNYSNKSKLNLLRKSSLYVENSKVEEKRIEFSSEFLSPDYLSLLLPNISSQQEEEIFNLFDEIKSDEVSLDLILFNLDKKLNELNNLKNAKRPNLFDVIVAIKKKIVKIKNLGLIKDGLPSWLKDENYAHIDIISGNKLYEDLNRRYITTILQNFLLSPITNYFRILVIDEAHQILDMKNSRTLSILTQLLREARKFNTAIILSTQNTNDVPESILDQFQNKFCFREKQNNYTENFPDQTCLINLFNSKTFFISRIKNFIDPFEQDLEKTLSKKDNVFISELGIKSKI